MKVDSIRSNDIPLFVNLLYLIPLNISLVFVKIFESVPQTLPVGSDVVCNFLQSLVNVDHLAAKEPAARGAVRVRARPVALAVLTENVGTERASQRFDDNLVTDAALEAFL